MTADQETTVTLRVSESDISAAIRREVVKLMERELKNFLLPADEYPEYVDVFVRYPEVMAKIRIHVKEREDGNE